MLTPVMLFVAGVLTPVGSVRSAQSVDTITLTVGHPSVDGTTYKEHWARASRSIMKDGKVIKSVTYRSHTYVTKRAGVPVVVVASEPYPDGPDQAFREETVLDLHTTALVHVEQHDGTGRLLIADVAGTHVTGRLRASRSEPEEAFDFTLETPAFFTPFVDAAIGATPIRDGQVWRVPTFSLGPKGRKVVWRTYHIVGHEPVPALSEVNDAWIVQDDAPGPTKIWITYEAPYLPQVLQYLPDGSVTRFASSLVKAPEDRASVAAARR
jgi:hypothetical protein